MWASILLIFSIIFLLVKIVQWKTNYWKSKKVKTPFEPQFIIGHAKDLISNKVHFGYFWKNVYDKLKQKHVKYGGIYLTLRPVFVPVDPDLIKQMLVKDFDHFMDHGFYVNEDADPFTGHLFALEGEKWKALRSKLTPAFASGKMKMMFSTVLDCASEMNKVFDKSSQDHQSLAIKDIFNRFTIDVIGSCAFGLECNSFLHPDAEFRMYCRKFFQHNPKLTFLLQFFLPSLMHLFKIKITPTDVADFFTKSVTDTVRYREENDVYRKDFMHLLIQLKNRGNTDGGQKLKMDDGSVGENGLKMTELAAQAFIFFIAGYETSSTTLTFASYELAQHKDIQKKIGEEIESVLKKYNNELTYDALSEMKYLDCVVNETLRKYPAAPLLPRVCTKDYKVPDTDVVIEKGTPVIIPTLGLHYDADFYPDPYKFDPDRFNEEHKNLRSSFTFLPFGEGPRTCIGMKFGYMEIKIALVTLLRNYSISLNTKTPVPLPIRAGGLILESKHDILINVSRI